MGEGPVMGSTLQSVLAGTAPAKHAAVITGDKASATSRTRMKWF